MEEMSKDKKSVMAVIDKLEAEVVRLTKLLDEEIPAPLKMPEKKINKSDYVVYRASYDNVTLSESYQWFQYKPYYGNWKLLETVEELNKRKEHILCVIAQYEIDLKVRYEEVADISKHNQIVQNQIEQIMNKIGVERVYQTYDYETTRSKTKKWLRKQSGYVGDIQRVAPTYNEYSNYADTIKGLKALVETEYNKVKDTIAKAEREEAAKKKAIEDTHKLALLRAKYTPDDAMASARDILDVLLSKDKYLCLAHYLQLNRGDWNDGYYYAEQGLQGFDIVTIEDENIYNCISTITQYEDVDGRYFRDCEYSYDVLFGKVEDESLLNDYGTLSALIDF